MNGWQRALAVLCAVCLVAGLIAGAEVFTRVSAQNHDTADSAALDELTLHDPAKVEEVLREREASRVTPTPTAADTPNPSEGASSVPIPTAPPTGIWAEFRNYAVLGDSRAVGFYYYHFLDKNRVLAGGGNTIRNIAGHTAQLQKINPSVVYICYGVNDAGIGYWKNGEAYAAELMTILANLQAALPRAQIVVSSILPAAEHTFQRSPSWRKIPDFNACVKRECAARGIGFADNDAIAAALMATQYQPDGVHLRPAFYPYWAENLLRATRGQAETPEETPAATPTASPEETPTPAETPTPESEASPEEGA